MKWTKRIVLFLLTNFLVIITISLICRIFHLQPFLTRYGMDYRSLLIFCFIWGFVGAFISLALSRQMAKWMLGVKIINKEKEKPHKLLQIIERLSRDAGLLNMPEVGIFHSTEMNAFATGPSKRHSLVAVSTGLLDKINEQELEAVLGHEISHIANGDMVTMTLLQGVVNAFVLFLSRALAFFISSLGKDRKGSSRGSFYALTFLFEILFMLLGSMVVALFSRIREFRADRGGACLTSREKMIAALEVLSTAKRQVYRQEKKNSSSLQALMIASSKKRGILQLFSTHPPIEERINRLKEMG